MMYRIHGDARKTQTIAVNCRERFGLAAASEFDLVLARPYIHF